MLVYDAQTILNRALLELGVIATAVEAYESTDPNVVLMRMLLNSLGDRLARKYTWSQLQKTHTFNTANGTEEYDLPVDFDRFTPATHWNRTTEWRLLGPASSQTWQTLQATSVVTGTTYFFQKRRNKLQLYPTPTSTEQVAYEYQSHYWVVPNNGSASVPEAAQATDNQDSIWFDGALMIAGLKVRWLQEKRLDATNALEEYQDLLAQAMGADAAAGDLDLTGGGGVRMISEANIPESGYG